MRALFILFAIFIAVHTIDAHDDKIHMRDINSLVLHAGQYTTARRSTPILQVSCTGGTAAGFSNVVDTILCTNMGWSGSSVNWKCETDIPKKYKLGKIHVSCEGYDFKGDPFVLINSCAVNYELNINPDYREPVQNNNYNQQSNNNNNYNNQPKTQTTYDTVTTWWDPWTRSYYDTHSQYTTNNNVPTHTYHTSSDAGATVVLFFFAIFLVMMVFCIVSHQGRIDHVGAAQSPIGATIYVPPSRPVYTGSWYSPYSYINGYRSWNPFRTQPYPVASHTTVTRTTSQQSYPNGSNSSSNSSDSNGSTHTSTSYGGSSSK